MGMEPSGGRIHFFTIGSFSSIPANSFSGMESNGTYGKSFLENLRINTFESAILYCIGICFIPSVNSTVLGIFWTVRILNDLQLQHAWIVAKCSIICASISSIIALDTMHQLSDFIIRPVKLG